MRLLGLSQLRFLTRTPWSTLTVLLGLTLGVASVVAVHKISQSVSEMLEAATPPHLSGFTHLLHKKTLTSSDYFALRAAWRRGDMGNIRNMLPIVEGHVVIKGKRVRVFATDWFAVVPELISGERDNDRMDGALRGQTYPDPVVVLDRSLGFAPGDPVVIDGRSYRVAGSVDGGMGAALFTDIGTAQTLLALDAEHLDYVGIAVSQPFAVLREFLENLLPGISAGFEWGREEWVPAGWQARTVDAELPSVGFARSVLFNLGALGSLAMLVAWFLIYQVAVIWLRRRRIMMDRLQMMGVHIAELRWGFLVTMAVLGVLATLIGLVVGMLFAHLLSRVSTAGVAVAGTDLTLGPWVLIKAAVSGIGVCVLAGLVAFEREWSVARRRMPVGFTALILIAVAVVGALVTDTGLVGGFASILAVCLVAVSLTRPVLSKFRQLARRLPGSLLTRLGFREVSWHPGDLSIATGALALAIATSIGIGLMVDSFRSDFSLMLNQRLAHDLFVTGDGRDLEDVARWLEARSDVQRVQRHGRYTARVEGRPVVLGYSNFTSMESSRYGFDRALGPLEAMVSERFAVEFDVGEGDRVELPDLSLDVVHIFSDFGDIRARLLVDSSSMDSQNEGQTFDRLSVDATDARLLALVLADRYPGLEIQPRADLRELALAIFDRTFAVTGGLTLVALVVAVIGLYNALLALRLNNANTTRLLTALGVAPGELRRLAVLRALCVGTLAILLAIPLGVAMAWLLCNVINPRAFGWSLNLRLSLEEMFVPIAWGFVAALVAGWLPAPRDVLNDEI
ncbi:MAG: ABC transporter permease [Gammaproteobacteria bacterium]|nr:ABC transporter permease [Gammaproteobacteria bacterium]